MGRDDGRNARIAIGSVILVILLMSIYGTRTAFSWLTNNNSTASNQPDQLEFTEVNASQNESAASDRNRDRTIAQTNTGQTNNQTSSQDPNADGESVLLPLQEAGTYIQRQKSIQEDPLIADSEVTAIAVVGSATSTAAQPNTISTTQTASDPQPTTTSSPSTGTSTPATSPAVPALW